MDQAQERHILGLDVIRFAAAAMVMAFHYGHDISPIWLSWTGWVGVEVFFVLSGYVIAASAEGSAAWAFGVNRIVRLTPAVWFCSTLIAVICAIGSTYPDLGMRYLRSITLWPTGPWVDGVIWTLPVEIEFYALVFMAMLAKVPLGLVLRAIAAISAGYWLLRMGAQFAPNFSLFSLASACPMDGPAFSIIGYGCYFALGGLLREGLQRGWSSSISAFAALCLLGGLSQIAFAASNWLPHNDLVRLPHAAKIVPACAWLAMCALIAISVWINGFAWRMAGSFASVFRLIGLSTYPLYLLHNTVGNALAWLPSIRTPLIASFIAITVSMAFAATLEPWAQGHLRSVLQRTLAGFPGRRRAVEVDRAVH
jgi:exopolysaccharide production protein ExoZ